MLEMRSLAGRGARRARCRLPAAVTARDRVSTQAVEGQRATISRDAAEEGRRGGGTRGGGYHIVYPHEC